MSENKQTTTNHPGEESNSPGSPAMASYAATHEPAGKIKPKPNGGQLIRKIAWILKDPPVWARKLRSWLYWDGRGKTVRGWSIRAKVASFLLKITDDREHTWDRQSSTVQFLRSIFGRRQREWTECDCPKCGAA